MSTIVTRAGKGSALTWTEGDNNITNLNTDKLESTGGTITGYKETVYSIGTTSGTIAPNAANGNVQTITLNGNLTLNAFTSPLAGQSITLIINTNGTSRTLTSSWLFAGASKTLSITSTVDIISVFYDGTSYYASLSKGFA
jgi:hypothetical protein